MIACAGTGVSAQLKGPSPFCGRLDMADWPAQAESLVGIWSVTHFGGWAEAGGVVIPFPADTTEEEVTFSMVAGDLLIEHPEAQAPIVLKPVDEARWVAGNEAVTLSPDDAALSLAGCDQLQLRRLIGTSDAIVDGQKLHFTFRLMLLTPKALYGGMQVDAMTAQGPVVARRAISMTRSGK